MTREEIARRVGDVIVCQLGVDPDALVPSARLADDLGADSLDLIELALGFEEVFGVRLPRQRIRRLETVGDAIESVARRLQHDGHPADGPGARRGWP